LNNPFNQLMQISKIALDIKPLFGLACGSLSIADKGVDNLTLLRYDNFMK